MSSLRLTTPLTLFLCTLTGCEFPCYPPTTVENSLMGAESNTIAIYVQRDINLEGISILRPLGRIIVIGLPLVPVSFPTHGFLIRFIVLVCVSFCEMGLNSEGVL